mmetsp:Transcript_21750/g.51947  ORF Transcript_21750/g.51947 Transcript_21750/m.51947 type:complete len:337 (-) Transcript_21750:127-1137(-)
MLDEEATHARGEGAEVAPAVQPHHHRAGEHEHGQGGLEEDDEGLCVGEAALALLHGRHLEHLHPDEDAEGAELLERLERPPAHDGHLDGAQGADDVEEGEGAVQLAREAAARHQRRRVHPDHVEHEDEAAPRRHHVDVREACEHTEDDRALGGRAILDVGIGAQRAHPAVEGAAHGRQRDALVVVPAAHRAHDVRRHDGHDHACCGASGGRLGALAGEQTEQDGGGDAEPRRHEAAHVVEAHRPLAAYRVESVPDGHRGDLHARVDGRADRPAQRVPGGVVEPARELVPAVIRQVHCRAEVEPRVELVDDAPIDVDGVQPDVIGVEARAVVDVRDA